MQGHSQHVADHDPAQKASDTSAKISTDNAEARSIVLPASLLCVGAVLSGMVAGVVLSGGNAANVPAIAPALVSAALTQLKASEISSALISLDQTAAQQAIEDAKTCKAPLVTLIIRKQPGSAGGVIRIQSGSYLSPPVQLTDAPQQIAVPFPAPYVAGKGVMSVVGSAQGALVFMTPGWQLDTLQGTATKPVHWDTDKPCQD